MGRPRRIRFTWQRRSPLYALEAFGIGNPWFLWRVAHNDFDEGLLDKLMTTVHTEDLGDRDSRQLAGRLGVVANPTRRIDMHARAM